MAQIATIIVQPVFQDVHGRKKFVALNHHQVVPRAGWPFSKKDADDDAFERILEQAVARTGTRLLAHCLMPNHWHLVVCPEKDGELSRFTGWLTLTHT